MSLNVKDFTNTLKKQIFLSLLQNINIDFASIKNKIYSYARSSSDDISSLIDLYDINFVAASSSTLNGSVLLLYLDFYSIYVSLYSVYNNYIGLMDVSKNKYLYIDDLCKDIESSIKSKSLNKENKNVLYIDFLDKNSTNIYRSDILSRSGTIIPSLSTTKIMSLPINNTKEIYPYNIIPNNLEVLESNQISDIGKDYINFNIIRKQNDYIGIVKNISNINQYASQATKITTHGIITDVSVDNIFIKISSITDDYITIKGSSSGSDWSSDIIIYNNTKTTLLIEDDLEIGLSITFVYDSGIKINDSWIIEITKKQLNYPISKLNIKFNNLDNISLFTLEDISLYRLYIKEILLKTKRYEVRQSVVYNTNSGNITIFPDSQVDECLIEFEQRDSSLYNDEGSIAYKYNFYVNNIKSISNEYISQGSLSFNSVDVTEINNILINAKEYIYVQSIDNIQRMFIEYNIYVESDLDTNLIPCLNKNQSSINEYLIPTQQDGDSDIKYITRFPVDTLQSIYLINLDDGTSSEIKPNGQDPYLYYDIIDYDYIQITIKTYNNENQYSISYQPKILKSSDIYNIADMSNWVKLGKIYFAYFYDIDLNIRLAIKMLNDLGDIITFSGVISPFIEMRSTEQQYLSPYVTEYSLLCN